MNNATKMVLASQKRRAAYGCMMAAPAGSAKRHSLRLTWQKAKRKHLEAQRICSAQSNWTGR